jgi:hypothetical protein
MTRTASWLTDYVVESWMFLLAFVLPAAPTTNDIRNPMLWFSHRPTWYHVTSTLPLTYIWWRSGACSGPRSTMKNIGNLFAIDEQIFIFRSSWPWFDSLQLGPLPLHHGGWKYIIFSIIFLELSFFTINFFSFLFFHKIT